MILQLRQAPTVRPFKIPIKMTISRKTLTRCGRVIPADSTLRLLYYWIDEEAAYNDHSVTIGRNTISLKRGDYLTRQSDLMSVMGWTRKQLRSRIDALKNMGLIATAHVEFPNTTFADRDYTIIHVKQPTIKHKIGQLNYYDTQQVNDTERPTEPKKRPTERPTEPQKNGHVNTYENEQLTDKKDQLSKMKRANCEATNTLYNITHIEEEETRAHVREGEPRPETEPRKEKTPVQRMREVQEEICALLQNDAYALKAKIRSDYDRPEAMSKAKHFAVEVVTSDGKEEHGNRLFDRFTRWLAWQMQIARDKAAREKRNQNIANQNGDRKEQKDAAARRTIEQCNAKLFATIGRGDDYARWLDSNRGKDDGRVIDVDG